MKHTAEGEVFFETDTNTREEHNEEKDRNIEVGVYAYHEREYYGKVRKKTKITRATYKYAYTLSLTPLS